MFVRLIEILLRRFMLACVMFSLVLLTGCANFYVDSTTKDVTPAQMKAVGQPAPVQLMFEFQTKGVLNTRATDLLAEQVTQLVKTSGLFSTVEKSPVNGGRILSIKLNNVPLTDDAAAKGFLTGLTLGVAGSQVTDGYVCTMKYADGTQAQPVVKEVRHAIHTVLGAKQAPTNAVPAKNADDAVRLMTRQIVNAGLKDLSFDPSFK